MRMLLLRTCWGLGSMLLACIRGLWWCGLNSPLMYLFLSFFSSVVHSLVFFCAACFFWFSAFLLSSAPLWVPFRSFVVHHSAVHSLRFIFVLPHFMQSKICSPLFCNVCVHLQRSKGSDKKGVHAEPLLSKPASIKAHHRGTRTTATSVHSWRRLTSSNLKNTTYLICVIAASQVPSLQHRTHIIQNWPDEQ